MTHNEVVQQLSSYVGLPYPANMDEMGYIFQSFAVKKVLENMLDIQLNPKQVSMITAGRTLADTLFSLSALYCEDEVWCNRTLCVRWAAMQLRLWIATGVVYHAPHLICLSPSLLSDSDTYGVSLGRNIGLAANSRMSGAGTYVLRDDTHPDVSNLALEEMLSLQKLSLMQLCTEYEKLPWEECEYGEFFDFVSVNDKYRVPVWSSRSERQDISLLRLKRHFDECKLCRWKNNTFQIKNLPAWFITDYRPQGRTNLSPGEYVRVVNVLKKQRDCLPSIGFQKRGFYTKIVLFAVLPPSEQDWLCLYSWPEKISMENLSSGKDYSIFDNFNRIMVTDVFNLVKGYLESIGYTFRELTHD